MSIDERMKELKEHCSKMANVRVECECVRALYGQNPTYERLLLWGELEDQLKKMKAEVHGKLAF